jgi:hypothetical protein
MNEPVEAMAPSIVVILRKIWPRISCLLNFGHICEQHQYSLGARRNDFS